MQKGDLNLLLLALKFWDKAEKIFRIYLCFLCFRGKIQRYSAKGIFMNRFEI